MYRKKCLETLLGWRDNLSRRNKVLLKMSKIYKVIQIILKILIAGITTGLITLTTYLSAEVIGASNNLDVYLGLSISILVLQSILGICNALDSVLNPGEKSKLFDNCVKNYDELIRELSINIDSLFKPTDLEDIGESYSDEIDEKREMYDFLCLMYSSKEQIILNQQPLLLFHRGNKICVN